MDKDPDPHKWCRSDRIRIHNTAGSYFLQIDSDIRRTIFDLTLVLNFFFIFLHKIIVGVGRYELLYLDLDPDKTGFQLISLFTLP